MSKRKYSKNTVKIMAVAFAVMMWIYVMSEMNPYIDREFKDIEVELLNSESLKQSGVLLIEPKVASIYVKVKGRRNDLLKLTDKDIIAQVDLMGYSEGSRKIPVSVRGPYKIEMVDFEPKEILFKFDDIIQKQIDVSIEAIGKTKEGYGLGKGIMANPNAVFVKGASSLVNSVTKVIASADVKNVTEDINIRVPVKAVNSKGKEVSDVELIPNIVDIKVPILKEKSVKIEPQIIGKPLKNFTVTDSVISPRMVKIKGYDELLDKITSIKTEEIDISYSIDDVYKDVKIIMPEGIELVDNEEKITVRVKIEEMIEKTFEYDFKDIELIKKDAELIIDEDNTFKKVFITVKGIESVINQLAPDKILPYINLEGFDEGKHLMKVKIKDLQQNIELIKIEPVNAEITLESIHKEDTEENIEEDTEENNEENNDNETNNNE